MESFYGGRQGASFVIVKRYKTIEAMCLEFSNKDENGNDTLTTSEVNYGEYVIIDSLYKNHKDNGKVFRRGMNYGELKTDVDSKWDTRKAALVKTYVGDDTSEWNSYSTNYKTINNIIIDWDEYINNYLNYSDDFKKERSADLYNYYKDFYEFHLDENGMLITDSTVGSDTTNHDTIEKYRTIKQKYDDLVNILDWEEKDYCAWAGAEYIGQILGPQGVSPLIKLEAYDTVVNYISAKKDKSKEWIEKAGSDYDEREDDTDVYNTSQPIDLVPGKYGEEEQEDGTIKPLCNDDIQYAYMNVRDVNGNVTGCKIGFKIPYLVIEYSGYSLSPYDEARTATATYDSTSRTWSYTDLVQRDDDETHPFYQHHNVYIPKGIKGDTWTNLREVNISYDGEEDYFVLKSINRRVRFWDTTTNALVEDDTVYWNNIKSEITANIAYVFCDEDGNPTSTIPSTQNPKKMFDKWIKYSKPSIKDTDNSNITNEIKLFDGTNYTPPTNSFTKTKAIYIVDYHNYDGSADGEKTIYYVGNDNTLQDIDIDTRGTITIKYNYNDSDIFYDKLTSIQTLALMEDGEIWWVDNRGDEHKITQATFGWLKGMKVDPDSGDVIYYWNHEGDFWTNGVQQHTQTITDENNNTCYITTAEGQFQMLKDLGINSVTEDNELDYDSDQQVWYRLNTDAEDVKNEIGAPLNYVAEAVITDNTHTNIASGHLLMYFSDPALRDKLAEEGKTIDNYPSLRLTDKTSGEASLIDGWYDAGTVSATYGLQIYSYGTADPNDATPPPDGKESWGYGKTTSDGTILYLYDYQNNKWVQVGKLSNSTSGMHVAMEESTEGSTPSDLKENGLWFVEEDQLLGDLNNTGYGLKDSGEEDESGNEIWNTTNWFSSNDIYKFMYGTIKDIDGKEI